MRFLMAVSIGGGWGAAGDDILDCSVFGSKKSKAIVHAIREHLMICTLMKDAYDFLLWSFTWRINSARKKEQEDFFYIFLIAK